MFKEYELFNDRAMVKSDKYQKCVRCRRAISRIPANALSVKREECPRPYNSLVEA